MDYFQRADWCGLCLTPQVRPCAIAVREKGDGVIICKNCIYEMAESLGILDVERDKVADMFR